MFKITFVAMSGGKREIVVAATSPADAVMAAATLRDFGLVLTCTKLGNDN